jgi:MFS family permease
MRLLPFIERAIAATLWTLGAGAIAIVVGLVIGSFSTSTRAEGVTLGLQYGQWIAVGLCPVVLWRRVYRTMWLRGPGRGTEAREPRPETRTSTALIREPVVKARSKPQTKPEESIEKAEKPRPKREPRVRREPTL